MDLIKSWFGRENAVGENPFNLPRKRIARFASGLIPRRSPAINSEFVICQNFVFRAANAGGFSHQTYEDGSAVTTVNFKSYTQGIPDPERRLFDFLISKPKPKSTDENS